MLRVTLRTLAFDIENIEYNSFARPPKGLDDLAGLSIEHAVRRFVEGPNTTEQGESRSYMDTIRYTTRRQLIRGRRPAVTREGYIGMLPSHARVGDLVFAFAGGMMLYVVRDVGEEEEGKFTFVGEGYVHGLIDTESGRGEEWERRRVVLV